MNLAPVGLVVYNRIEHTKRVIEALKKNTLAIDTDLYIFSDAPSKEEDKKSVSELRKYLKTVKDGFKNVYIYEAEKNLGIKYSTVKAVNTIFENHEYFIGLEDDIETNKYFLEFMNNALNYYKDDEDVMAITAFSHKHATKNHKYDVIFTYAFHSWGWGTWKSKWNNINWDTCDTSWYNKSIKHKILG
ncbi:glycosyltransferase [uncultured Brachyspira sp.]|uniref:glycosyltransferase n=1 Tax=uncultured Brachyspira sp. TaxID=221953 RepID=UPI0026022F7E|nr:glycosyltransferase [uncultured Brachyspira sp.]